MTSDRRRQARGTGLIETLIAMALVSFSLLALGALQMNLKRHAQLAAQRTAAVRLAEDRLDSLRTSTASTAAGAVGPSGEERVTVGGLDYLRRWTAASTQTGRLVTVTVSRVGAATSVTPIEASLRSIVGSADPVHGADLLLPPAGGPVRRVRGRDLSIPYGARPLAGRLRGHSAMAWGDGSHLVFSDADGRIVAKCPFEPTDDTNIARDCVPMNSRLVEGYLSGDALPAGATLGLGPDRDDACAVEPLEGGMWRYRCLAPASEPVPAVTWAHLPPGFAACRYEAVAPNADPWRTRRNFHLSATGRCPAGTTA